MKIKLAQLSALVLLLVLTLSAQSLSPLSVEMGKLGVNTVLVFPSTAVDDTLVWSADSHYLD